MKTRPGPSGPCWCPWTRGSTTPRRLWGSWRSWPAPPGRSPVLTLTQKRPAPDTATCIGSGMVEQAAELCRQEEIDLLLFDRELTPTQIRNLEKACGVRVIDRTTLILDIFAQRARSKEGKLQVELAQLRYLLPRLGGQGTALSRLGGGIGTRGPGETKLETDRRHIRRRIGSLKEQLKEVEAARGSSTGGGKRTAPSPWPWWATPTRGRAP